jgi:transposase
LRAARERVPSHPTCNASRELRGRLRAASRWRSSTKTSTSRAASWNGPTSTLQVLRDIANRTRALDTQAATYTRQIDALARELAPALMDEPGVGPICAAKPIAFNPARFTSEAAFARANGTAPQPASSGKTVRHRLSRGGDRQINTAIYTIALSRSVHHPPSRAYIQRRINEGKTKREAMRSLKRYLSRDLYNKLSKTPLTT